MYVDPTRNFPPGVRNRVAPPPESGQRPSAAAGPQAFQGPAAVSPGSPSRPAHEPNPLLPPRGTPHGPPPGSHPAAPTEAPQGPPDDPPDDPDIAASFPDEEPDGFRPLGAQDGAAGARVLAAYFGDGRSATAAEAHASDEWDDPRGRGLHRLMPDDLPRGVRHMAEVQAMAGPEIMNRGGRVDLTA